MGVLTNVDAIIEQFHEKIVDCDMLTYSIKVVVDAGRFAEIAEIPKVSHMRSNIKTEILTYIVNSKSYCIDQLKAIINIPMFDMSCLLDKFHLLVDDPNADQLINRVLTACTIHSINRVILLKDVKCAEKVLKAIVWKKRCDRFVIVEIPNSPEAHELYCEYLRHHSDAIFNLSNTCPIKLRFSSFYDHKKVYRINNETAHVCYSNGSLSQQNFKNIQNATACGSPENKIKAMIDSYIKIIDLYGYEELMPFIEEHYPNLVESTKKELIRRQKGNPEWSRQA